MRTGKLRIVFLGLAFIGADSDKALRTAIAAGQDDHLWDVVHGLYASQGAENSGWVTDELVGEIAARVPGLDGEKLLATRWENSVEPDLKHAADAATQAGVHGTPAFQLGPTGGRLEPPRRQLARPGGDRPGSRGIARPMSERTARLASAVVAVLGAAISAYLLYVRQTGGTLVCSTGGCETVQSSTYAELLGVPVAALGLAGFLGLLVTALARGEWARLSQATLALTALGFSIYLLYIQVAVIDAVCQWCLAIEVLTLAIVALGLVRLRLADVNPR